MNNRGAAGALVLLWLLWPKRDAVQNTAPRVGSGVILGPVVTFPPVVPIGNGQPEKSWAGGLVSSVISGASYVGKLARGIRNNNPLNIENNSRNPWVGLDPAGNDGRYAVFVHAKYGIRAAGRVLDSYQRAGHKTVRQIITRWAPPHENDTESYIKAVLKVTGWHDGFIPHRANYPDLLAVMIRQENGSQPYSRENLFEWVNLP